MDYFIVFLFMTRHKLFKMVPGTVPGISTQTLRLWDGIMAWDGMGEPTIPVPGILYCIPVLWYNQL